MANFTMFQQGDAVFYCGEKFKSDLFSKEGKPFKGWIHAQVHNQPNTFVVEFPEAKDSDYVLHGSLLTKARPKNKEYDGPDIQPRRRSKKDPESE